MWSDRRGPSRRAGAGRRRGRGDDRGNDTSGSRLGRSRSQGRTALGHRRLRIIDLTEAGGQPMVDADLGLTICWNGCIDNYEALRAELEAHGYRFFSHSDTEVILKAYHRWGDRFVERLYGMFAFAIVERDRGRVLLGRDRVGIKPLYGLANHEPQPTAAAFVDFLFPGQPRLPQAWTPEKPPQ